MSAPFRIMRRDELLEPSKMEPAVVLRISLLELASSLLIQYPKLFDSISHDRDSDALYAEVADVQLAFVAFREEPREVHVYVSDRDVGRSNRKLMKLLEAFPLKGVRGDWWVRGDQPHWPGNEAETFFINGYKEHTF